MDRKLGQEVHSEPATPGAFIGWALLAAMVFGLTYAFIPSPVVAVLGILVVGGLLLVGVIAKGVQVGSRR